MLLKAIIEPLISPSGMAPRGLKSAPLDMKNVELWRSGLPSHHGLKTIPSETLGSDYPERLSRLRADLKDT